MPGGLRVMLAVQPTDLRRGVDGLAAHVVAALGHDPRVERAYFVFTNSKRNRVKVLWRDASGWCVLYKRFDVNVAAFPRDVADGASSVVIDARALSKLLDGVERARRRTERDVARSGKVKARELINAPSSVPAR